MTKTVKRRFRLEGENGLGPKPRPELIGPVLSGLNASLQDAVRMRFLHSSRAPGRIAKPLRSAVDVRFLRHQGDGPRATLLYFEVPTLGSTAADYFSQQNLWEDAERPDPEETAFELFGDALSDVAARREDSQILDRPLLESVSKYRTALKAGIAGSPLETTRPRMTLTSTMKLSLPRGVWLM